MADVTHTDAPEAGLVQGFTALSLSCLPPPNVAPDATFHFGPSP